MDASEPQQTNVQNMIARLPMPHKTHTNIYKHIQQREVNTPSTTSTATNKIQSSESPLRYLGRLEAHLELLASCESRQHHIVEGLVGPSSIRHLLKVNKGITQGADACREDRCIGEGAKLGEHASDRAQCGCCADVAQPDPVGGGAGPLPLPPSAAMQQPWLHVLPFKVPEPGQATEVRCDVAFEDLVVLGKIA